MILLSPERLASDSFKLNVLQPIANTLGLLVVDEVHCISVWGHDFRPDYRRIGVALQLIPADTPVLGTTATANERVLDDVRAVMGSDVTIQRGSLLRSSLALYVVHMDDTASRLAWLATNLRNMPTSSGIIYTSTRHDADQVTFVYFLIVTGLPACYLDLRKSVFYPNVAISLQCPVLQLLS